MNTAPLVIALRNKSRAVRTINVETAEEDQTLRDAADLLRVLANLMDGMLPTKAFGAPGDWGYDTDLGQAVIALHAASTCSVAQPQPQLLP